jgi:hypothetical protein
MILWCTSDVDGFSGGEFLGCSFVPGVGLNVVQDAQASLDRT